MASVANMTFMVVRLLGLSQAHYTNQQVCTTIPQSKFEVDKESNLSILAGVRPALTAATLMTGLAGVWSYIKKAV